MAGPRLLSLLQNVQTGSEAHPALHAKDTEVPSRGQSGLRMTFTARLHLQPKVRMSGAVPILPLYTFKASTGGKLYFYLLNHFATHILRYYYCHIITHSLTHSLSLSSSSSSRIIVLVSHSISLLPPKRVSFTRSILPSYIQFQITIYQHRMDALKRPQFCTLHWYGKPATCVLAEMKSLSVSKRRFAIFIIAEGMNDGTSVLGSTMQDNHRTCSNCKL